MSQLHKPTRWGSVMLPQALNPDGSLRGYIVVKNYYPKPQHRHLPSVFRFPGGHSDPEDTDPAKTAARECTEESGADVELPKHRLTVPSHDGTGKHFFTGVVPFAKLAWLYNPDVNSSVSRPKGNRGEWGYLFTPEKFRELIERDELLDIHVTLLKDSGLLELVLRGELIT